VIFVSELFGNNRQAYFFPVMLRYKGQQLKGKVRVKNFTRQKLNLLIKLAANKIKTGANTGKGGKRVFFVFLCFQP